MIIRIKKTEQYFTMRNSIVVDLQLNDEGYRLYSFLMSCPDDWTMYNNDIINRFQKTEYWLKKALSSLKKAGYLERIQKHKDGRYEWETIVHEIPIIASHPTKNENQKKAKIKNTIGRISTDCISTDIIKTKRTKKKEKEKKFSFSKKESFKNQKVESLRNELSVVLPGLVHDVDMWITTTARQDKLQESIQTLLDDPESAREILTNVIRNNYTVIKKIPTKIKTYLEKKEEEAGNIKIITLTAEHAAQNLADIQKLLNPQSILMRAKNIKFSFSPEFLRIFVQKFSGEYHLSDLAGILGLAESELGEYYSQYKNTSNRGQRTSQGAITLADIIGS